MVFTLPSNANQALYLENTITDFKMELPELNLSHGTDYSIALASFTYPHTWHNVHDLANPWRQHFSSAIMPPGTISWWPSGPAWRLAQAGWRWRELSLLVGWPDWETLLLGRGNTCHMAASQSKWDLVESFFVHCNLPANGHVIGNVRNCLLRTVPVKGHFGEVMCYEPQWLDWLPVCWTEFKARPHSYNRWSWPEGSIWRQDMLSEAAAQAERQLPSDLKKGWHHHHHHHHHHGGLHHTIHQLLVPARSWPCQHLQRAVSIRPSLCPRALGCRPVCT